MDTNQVAGALRIAVPMLLAYGASKGWFTTADAAGLSDAIVNGIVAAITIGSIVLSIRANSQKAHIQNVAAMRDVQVVVGPVAPAAAQNAADDPAQPNVISQK